jgi:hypothetical protein
MTDDNTSHLDEAQVLISLVDAADLPAAARAHLATCPTCQAGQQRHADRLQRLAELARESVPAPSRRVALPWDRQSSDGRKSYLGWSLAWKPAFALAAVALVMTMLVSFWGKSGQERRLSGLDQERREDQALITEVQRLETDALPSLYAAIAGDDDLDDDEDLWDWMVPGSEDETLSGWRSSESDRNTAKTIVTVSPLDAPLEVWFWTV